jgi:predicted DNA binding CopG/RHH family protein
MVRNRTVKVKFDTQEYEKVKQRSKQAGLPLSTYIRYHILSLKIEL